MPDVAKAMAERATAFAALTARPSISSCAVAAIIWFRSV